jgi:hypothetical protein
MEKIRFYIFDTFQAVCLNPEWWCVQYAPVFFTQLAILFS